MATGALRLHIRYEKINLIFIYLLKTSLLVLNFFNSVAILGFMRDDRDENIILLTFISVAILAVMGDDVCHFGLAYRDLYSVGYWRPQWVSNDEDNCRERANG